MDQFGALDPTYGTLSTSFIALIIAVPVSFGIALFLSELSPVWLRRPLGIAIELLAAVPSIVYGMWGLMVFAPIFAKYAQPLLSGTLGQLPFVGTLFSGPPLGIGILSAGIILAIMIIPFIASVMRDVSRSHPPCFKESFRRVWMHDLGSGLEYQSSHTGLASSAASCSTGPRAGRNHGRDVHHRQLNFLQHVALRARQQHHLDVGQRIR
ncbi:hypothetical protein [Propionivibrio sp.]|uniref:hypothetical protein n=1 Tax=Propionivibrio sp. TaxID=2212460 RepID=UPI0025F5155E|nr:hypothetical protein [Propionivibrio sp.]